MYDDKCGDCRAVFFFRGQQCMRGTCKGDGKVQKYKQMCAIYSVDMTVCCHSTELVGFATTLYEYEQARAVWSNMYYYYYSSFESVHIKSLF